MGFSRKPTPHFSWCQEVSTSASAPSGHDAIKKQLGRQLDHMTVARRESEVEAAAARPPEDIIDGTTGESAPVIQQLSITKRTRVHFTTILKHWINKLPCSIA